MPLINAQSLVRSALRLAGVTASGETPTPDEEADALTTLNDILDLWSSNPDLNYESVHSVVAITSTTVPVAMPTPNVTTLSPTSIAVSDLPPMRITTAFYRSNNVDTPLRVISEFDYLRLSAKDTANTPECVYANRRPDGIQLYLYPVPASGAVHVTVSFPMPTFASLTSDVFYPAGYAVALRYNLALNLAGEYNLTASDAINLMAMEATLGLKRLTLSMRPPPQQVTCLPTGNGVGSDWINTGGFA